MRTFLLSSLIVLSLSAWTGSFAQAQSSSQGQAQSQTQTQNSADQQFISQMIDHHKQGISMAQMAEKKASNSGVKAMARKIAKEQTHEVRQLEKWQAKWFPGQESASSQASRMDMSRLEQASGKDFDVAFLDMMTQHHRDGIKMTEDSMNQLQKSQLKKFARNTLKTQRAEIAKMDQRRQALASKSQSREPASTK